MLCSNGPVRHISDVLMPSTSSSNDALAFTPEPIEAAQGFGEQVFPDCNLGHLEGDIAPMADDLGANLNKPFSERLQRPVLHGVGQRQGS